MKKTLINYVKRGKYDELYTPKYAITPLLKYLPKGKVYWECTDFGDSNITKVLKENGYEVRTSHINYDIDFLNDTPPFDFDIIITNPPYSLKDEFLKKCYEYNKPFALLLPITALEGVKRGRLYRKYGIELMVFDKRINFYSPKSGNKNRNWFNAGWFCWKLLPEKLIFKELFNESNIYRNLKLFDI